MFVSSYNTYISTNSSQNSNKVAVEKKHESGKLFANKLNQTIASTSFTNTSKPINYIKEGNTQYNKELIRSQQEFMKKNVDGEFKKATDSIQKYSTTLTLSSAKTAYVQNSSLFPFLRKPQAPLDQTPKIDNTKQEDIKEITEQNIRYTMINTYLDNDRYYQITA